jgi:hypothetical protein
MGLKTRNLISEGVYLARDQFTDHNRLPRGVEGMIESYFQKGVRLRWTPPGSDASGSRDGSIIKNPPRAPCPMVYDGVDGELVRFASVRVKTSGLTKGTPIPYSWLAYCPGHTSKLQLSGNDVLTGFMSGCLVVLWADHDGRWVGHIGTDVDNPAASQRVKLAFVRVQPPNTTGFDPAAAWGAGDIGPLLASFRVRPDHKVLALVTSGGEFYSVLLLNLRESRPEGLAAGSARVGQDIGPPVRNAPSNLWCVGGVKRVPAMSANGLVNKMIPPPARRP